MTCASVEAFALIDASTRFAGEQLLELIPADLFCWRACGAVQPTQQPIHADASDQGSRDRDHFEHRGAVENRGERGMLPDDRQAAYGRFEEARCAHVDGVQHPVAVPEPDKAHPHRHTAMVASLCFVRPSTSRFRSTCIS